MRNKVVPLLLVLSLSLSPLSARAHVSQVTGPTMRVVTCARCDPYVGFGYSLAVGAFFAVCSVIFSGVTNTPEAFQNAVATPSESQTASASLIGKLSIASAVLSGTYIASIVALAGVSRYSPKWSCKARVAGLIGATAYLVSIQGAVLGMQVATGFAYNTLMSGLVLNRQTLNLFQNWAIWQGAMSFAAMWNALVAPLCIAYSIGIVRIIVAKAPRTQASSGPVPQSLPALWEAASFVIPAAASPLPSQ